MLINIYSAKHSPLRNSTLGVILNYISAPFPARWTCFFSWLIASRFAFNSSFRRTCSSSISNEEERKHSIRQILSDLQVLWERGYGGRRRAASHGPPAKARVHEVFGNHDSSSPESSSFLKARWPGRKVLHNFINFNKSIYIEDITFFFKLYKFLIYKFVYRNDIEALF